MELGKKFKNGCVHHENLLGSVNGKDAVTRRVKNGWSTYKREIAWEATVIWFKRIMLRTLCTNEDSSEDILKETNSFKEMIVRNRQFTFSKLFLKQENWKML